MERVQDSQGGGVWDGAQFTWALKLMQGEARGGNPTETEVRQGEVMVCMQPGQLCGWGRRQRTATAHRVGGKSGPSDGEGSGCPLLLSLHTRLPPAEESGAGWIFWSGDRGCWVGWAQSGTSGWAGSPLSPRR